jgi:hypothetical protein
MKFLNWLVFSSENPQETAMTIQGILVLQIPLVISFLQTAGINIVESQVKAYVTMAIGVMGAILTIVGIVRKLINTYSDKEVVVFTKKKTSIKK